MENSNFCSYTDSIQTQISFSEINDNGIFQVKNRYTDMGGDIVLMNWDDHAGDSMRLLIVNVNATEWGR